MRHHTYSAVGTVVLRALQQQNKKNNMKPAILDEITEHEIELCLNGHDYLVTVELKCVDEGEDTTSDYPGSNPEWECAQAHLYWLNGEDEPSPIPDEATADKVLDLAVEDAINRRAYDVWHS